MKLVNTFLLHIMYYIGHIFVVQNLSIICCLRIQVSYSVLRCAVADIIIIMLYSYYIQC